MWDWDTEHPHKEKDDELLALITFECRKVPNASLIRRLKEIPLQESVHHPTPVSQPFFYTRPLWRGAFLCAMLFFFVWCGAAVMLPPGYQHKTSEAQGHAQHRLNAHPIGAKRATMFVERMGYLSTSTQHSMDFVRRAPDTVTERQEDIDAGAGESIP